MMLQKIIYQNVCYTVYTFIGYFCPSPLLCVRVIGSLGNPIKLLPGS